MKISDIYIWYILFHTNWSIFTSTVGARLRECLETSSKLDWDVSAVCWGDAAAPIDQDATPETVVTAGLAVAPPSVRRPPLRKSACICCICVRSNHPLRDQCTYVHTLGAGFGSATWCQCDKEGITIRSVVHAPWKPAHAFGADEHSYLAELAAVCVPVPVHVWIPSANKLTNLVLNKTEKARARHGYHAWTTDDEWSGRLVLAGSIGASRRAADDRKSQLTRQLDSTTGW